MDIVQNIAIPALRQDLKIYPGNHDTDGSPTWMIYEPLGDNYFKIGWFEFECLQRFGRADDLIQLVQLVNKETTLSIGPQDVLEFLMFLANAGLLQANLQGIRDILEQQRVNKSKSLLHTLFLRYIFLRIPLFKPQKFLKNTFPFISFMFTRTFFLCMLVLLGFGIFLTLQRWDEFLASFTTFVSFENIILIFAATIIIKTAHELGHAYMAYKHKVPVSVMGITFIVFYPILYTETTNAWRIYDRKKRMQISAAGLMAELCLASVALLIWNISTPGLVQNLSYFVAFLSLLLSVFVNANPLKRFDGYYLLSDLIGIDNLQQRSFKFFKWKLRNFVCSMDEEPPESIPEKQMRFLVFFGVAELIYYCFLYSGIALAVYYIVFKPLGFILAAILLSVVLGLPVLKELLYWYSEREKIVKNRTPQIIFGGLACLLILSFLPLSDSINVPAVLHYKQYKAFYAPDDARIDEIYVHNAQPVSAGDILVKLSSFTLDQDIKTARLELQLYETIEKRQETSAELRHQSIDIKRKIKEIRTQLDGFLVEKQGLTIRAPFDGIIRDIEPDINKGRWVNPEIMLMRLVNKDSLEVTGYVDSGLIGRIEKPASGVFKSDTFFLGSSEVELSEVSSADTKNIKYQELSSIYGGSIPAMPPKGPDNTQSRTPLYLLKFSVKNAATQPDFTQKGIVILKVRPVSFSGKMIEKLTSLFLRETAI